jgi:hypothetical protein
VLHEGEGPAANLVPEFFPWPDGISPRFEFGSPYADPHGCVWQLCFDQKSENFKYVELGASTPAIQPIDSPNTCTGWLNYRLAKRQIKEPWNESSHGDHADSFKAVMPGLEFVSASNREHTVGVVFTTTRAEEGLEGVLNDRQDVLLELVWEGWDGPVVLYKMKVKEASRRVRFFIFKHVLWVFHAALPDVFGWKIEEGS